MFCRFSSDAPAVGNRHWPADPPWPPYDETAGRGPDDREWDSRQGWYDHQHGGPTESSGHTYGGGVDPWYGHPHAPDQWYDPRYPNEQPGRGPGAGYPREAYPPGPGQVPAAARSRRPHPPSPPEPEPDDEPSWLPTLTWTIGCFVVPVALYLVWAATRSGTPLPDCLDDSGAPCPAPRTEALRGLVDTAPGLIGAVTLALLAAVGLRLMIDTWRASTVGIAAAVVGAGAATLIATAFG